MLEKTAASLEPCSLQRVFPAATKTFRSRRQLHTAFWQHGAAEVELSGAWQALMHGVFDSNGVVDVSDSKTPALRASSFLLDFLYPNPTFALLRPFNERLDIYRSGQSFARVSPRLYTSSGRPPAPKNDGKGSREILPGNWIDFTNTVVELEEPVLQTNVSPEDAVTQDTEQPSVTPIQEDEHISQTDSVQIPEVDSAHAIELQTLLAIKDEQQDTGKIWHHYSALSEKAQMIFFNPVLAVLAEASRMSDAPKISRLFEKLKPGQWNGPFFLAGLKAEIALKNEKAVEIFEQGLRNPNIAESFLVDGFDHLLAEALGRSSLVFLRAIWKCNNQMRKRFDFDGVTSRLQQVASVPDVAKRVLKLRATLMQPNNRPLATMLARRALLSCTWDQALPLLTMANNPLAYEEFLRVGGCDRYNKKLMIQAYLKYREMPDCKASHAVLHEVFRAYTGMLHNADKLRGVELLWSDWYRFDTQPSRRAYQKFMSFYASRGDKDRVYQLWTDYVRLYSEVTTSRTLGTVANVLYQDDTFAHLLRVHAVRRETHEVQNVFDDITGKFGIQPNRVCWNILLDAYVTAGDYEGAMRTFDGIGRSIGRDSFSYATLMQLFASRGDLGFTVELYRRARREKLPTNNIAMLINLVDAYCQNDHFTEAEDVCVSAAKKGIKDTSTWNRLLYALALQRNLGTINRLLSVMSDLDINYDGTTYRNLLLGLSLCDQSHHALHLLALAVQENVFEVTPDHFHTLIGGFIKTGEPALAFRVHRLMEECGFKPSAQSLVQLTAAFSQFHKLPHKYKKKFRSERELIGSALREFYKFYPNPMAGKNRQARHEEQGVPASKLLLPSAQSFQFSRVVYLLTQMKDFVEIRHLVELFRYTTTGDANSTDPLPIELLDSLMLAQFHEKKYDDVQKSWDTMFDLARKGGISADWSEAQSSGRKISKRFQYVLSGGLKIMQAMLIDTGTAADMMELVEDVRAAGFELDSRNWNVYVQGLIKLGSYKEAFKTCEYWLMPNWAGWYRVRGQDNVKNKLPLDLRRKGSRPRYLRPTAHTLYYLAKGFMDLDKMSPFSAEAAAMRRDIEQDTPRCHLAIMTMIRANSQLEQDILEGRGPALSPVKGGYDEGIYESEEEQESLRGQSDAPPRESIQEFVPE